jgi:uncharacterized protein (DUF58 family)
MDDVRLVVIDRQEKAEEKKDARAKLTEKIQRGEMPTFAELAEARGLVVRERRDSIFSDAWMPLALLFLLTGFVFGRNVALLALGLVLLLIYGVSSWWQQNALIGVTYEREFDRRRVFPGEPIEMTLNVGNQKPLPLTWLRFTDRMPVAPVEADKIAEVSGETHGFYMLQNVFSISGNSRLQRTFTLRFPWRGYYKLGPVTYRSGDIFTLFTVEREHDYTQRLIVYPQVWPLEALGLPTKEPFGEVTVQRSLFTDPIKTRGIRDYEPSDRFRDVHWKASARRGELQTKVYDPSTGMNLVVFLNVATMRRHWMGFHPERLERAISVAASIASYATEQKWGIGLYVNGSVPKSDQPIRVPPGRSPDQLSHVLEALAATTEFATGSVEKLLQQESTRLPWAATLVLVTAYVTEEMGAVLLRLKEAGRRVALISLAEEPLPQLRGILSYHIPSGIPAVPGESPMTGRGEQQRLTEASLAAIPVPDASRPGEQEPEREIDFRPRNGGS